MDLNRGLSRNSKSWNRPADENYTETGKGSSFENRCRKRLFQAADSGKKPMASPGKYGDRRGGGRSQKSECCPHGTDPHSTFIKTTRAYFGGYYINEGRNDDRQGLIPSQGRS